MTDIEKGFFGEEKLITVKVNPGRAQSCVRLVFHADVNKYQADLVLKKVIFVIKEFDESFRQ